MSNSKIRVWVLLVCVVGAAGLLIWHFNSSTPPPAQVAQDAGPEPPAATPEATPEVVAPSPLETQWGLQVLGLSLTNNATAVHVRYTVVDPQKTLLLSETNASAYLVNQATGAKLPMIAPPQSATTAQGAMLRTTRRMARFAGQFPPPSSRLIAGRTYSLEIPNWGRALQSGSKVSLVVNEFRQDDLTVE